MTTDGRQWTNQFARADIPQMLSGPSHQEWRMIGRQRRRARVEPGAKGHLPMLASTDESPGNANTTVDVTRASGQLK